MNSSTFNTNWSKRVDRFLALACEAEAAGDYPKAGHAFVIALLCEGRLRPDVRGCWEYVYSAMPVY